MKKIVSATLIALLLSVFCMGSVITASAKINLTPNEDFDTSENGENEENGENDTEKPKENSREKPNKKPFPKPPRGGNHGQKPPKYSSVPPVPVELNSANCKSAYLIDFGSGKVMFAQNENARFPIASMCKIMSLLLIYENISAGHVDENGQITIGENASGMGGSQVFLETNGTYKITDLIKSIVVASANDATVAMAEHIAGSEEGFVVLMNNRAKELGMNNTNFINCTGLPQPGQYSCAKDCSLMMKQLLTHSIYFKYSRIWMDKIPHSEGRVTEISNTNKLIRFFKGCDGGKTGYTSEAQHCITATAERAGMRLISVIIGAENSKVRFAEASRLLNYGFANYVSKQLVFSDKPLDLTVNIKGGKQKTLEIAASENYSILSGKFDKINFFLDYNLPENIAAPVKKGDVVGSISVIINNEIVKEINVLALNDVAKNTYGDVINDIINNW